MNVVEYVPAYAQPLLAALDTARMEAPFLRNDAYVRHYFLGHPCCRLHLLLADDGTIVATLGSERIRLRIGPDTFDAAICSNTYSLRPGAFPLLFMHWMKSAELGLMFPGNELLTTMLARQKRWLRIPGLRTCYLNWGYPARPDDPVWKRILKPPVRAVTRVDAERLPRRIARMRRDALHVVEESRISEDMVGARDAPGLRLDTAADHLNWRFSTQLGYVKYRVFRIVDGRSTRGYAVLADWPHCLVVSHCEGDDPEAVACGALLAVAALNRGALRHRKVLLTSMHAAMYAVFERFGFRPKKSDTPFYVAPFGARTPSLDHVRGWIVNMDLGDLGSTVGLVYKP